MLQYVRGEYVAKLAEITRDVQQLPKYCQYVGVDVTIVDNHLYRVAGTGQYFTSTRAGG